MRIWFYMALCGAALSAQYALADDKPASGPPAPAAQSGVTVNMGALPTAKAQHKPAAQKPRASLTPMPRPKPTADTLAGAIPMPRPKPTAVALAAHKPRTPQVGTEADPAHETALTSPQAAAAVASKLRGEAMAADAAKPIDPTIGFSVLTRVRFQSGHSELGDDAKAALDPLVKRLLKNEERVRLAAFSGQAGDISSGARRLSLRRALAVRTYLVGKGVPINRVDVLSFGGSADGITDRVDVLVRTT